jgi:hypothetical protein
VSLEFGKRAYEEILIALGGGGLHFGGNFDANVVRGCSGSIECSVDFDYLV